MTKKNKFLHFQGGLCSVISFAALEIKDDWNIYGIIQKNSVGRTCKVMKDAVI
jgi:hypothetical protein